MRLALLVLVLVISGCGHQRIDYEAKPEHFSSRQQAAEYVEQAFYEDYGSTRPEQVIVGERYIVLTDGLVSTGSGAAAAMPFGGATIVSGTSTSLTREAGQRVYFNSLGHSTLHKKRLREGRYVVIIRGEEGAEIRHVHLRTMAKASKLIDALEYLKRSSNP